MKIIKALFLLIFIAIATTTSAQEIIFKRDGGKDTVKVLEITPTEIIYKKFKRQNGPTYRINKADVVLIEHEDGEVEVIEAPPAPPPVKTEEEKKKEFAKSLGRSILSLNYMNFFIGNANVGYERIFDRAGIFGLKVSVNYHIPDIENDVLGYDRKFTVGFDFNFYPAGHGKVKYFLGPALRLGRWEENFFGFFGEPKSEYNAVSILFNNGFYVQPTKGFYMSFVGGLGIANLTDRNNGESLVEPDGVLGFNVGVRF